MFLLNDEVQQFSLKSDHFWSFFQWDEQMHGVLWIYAFTLAFVAPNCWKWFFSLPKSPCDVSPLLQKFVRNKIIFNLHKTWSTITSFGYFFNCFFLLFLPFFAFFILYLFWLLLNFSTLQSRFFFNNFKRFSQWLPWLFYLLIADKMRNSQDSRNF